MFALKPSSTLHPSSPSPHWTDGRRLPIAMNAYLWTRQDLRWDECWVQWSPGTLPWRRRLVSGRKDVEWKFSGEKFWVKRTNYILCTNINSYIIRVIYLYSYKRYRCFPLQICFFGWGMFFCRDFGWEAKFRSIFFNTPEGMSSMLDVCHLCVQGWWCISPGFGLITYIIRGTGISTSILLMFMVNVGKYIHGWYGYVW